MCTEAIKYGGERLPNKLVTLLNLVKNNLVIPYEWKTFICVPLPKKGEPTKMSKYRSITLILITAILYNRLLLNHIRDPREKILHVNLAGFRPVVAVLSKSTKYGGYYVLSESEIRTSCSSVPSFIFARPLTALPDRSCSTFSPITGSLTMSVEKSRFYTLLPSYRFLSQ